MRTAIRRPVNDCTISPGKNLLVWINYHTHDALVPTSQPAIVGPGGVRVRISLGKYERTGSFHAEAPEGSGIAFQFMPEPTGGFLR
jgi:hypothetical protein